MNNYNVPTKITPFVKKTKKILRTFVMRFLMAVGGIYVFRKDKTLDKSVSNALADDEINCGSKCRVHLQKGKQGKGKNKKICRLILHYSFSKIEYMVTNGRVKV